MSLDNIPPAQAEQPDPKLGRGRRRAQLKLIKGQEGAEGPPKDKPAHVPGSDGWPWGFHVNKSGLYYQAPSLKEDGEESLPVRLGPPIEILGEARNGASEGWGLLLRFKDPDGVEHDYILGRGKLAADPSTWIGEMMSLGWIADGRKGNRSLLADCFSRCAPKGRIRAVARTGWTDDGQAFVLPSETLGDGPEQYLLAPRPAKDIFSRGGSFDDWSKTVGRWAIGNHLLLFSLSAALSGSLLKLLGLESGGVHFYGSSSSGKTTILEAACSVWGHPAVFGGASWRSTDTGLELRAALQSDCFMPLDEVGTAPEKAIKEASYLVANETGKTRGRRDASLRPAVTWRILALSTGEIPFSIALKQAGENQKAGQAVRMIDIPADAGMGLGAFQCLHGLSGPAALSEAIKKAAKENYGWAGPEFVRRLLAMSDRDKTLKALFEKMKAALTQEKAAPEVDRAVKRFALIATAGELATRWGFFEGLAQDGAESFFAVKFCLDAWLAARGGTGCHDEVQAEARLLDFIGRNGARFQDMTAGGDDRPVINRAGFRKAFSTGETEYYIFPDVFQNEICAGLGHVQAARTLADLSILKRGEGRNLARNMRLPGLGVRRVYDVSLPDNEDQGGDNSPLV